MIAGTLYDNLVFPTGKLADMEQRLHTVGRKLSSLKQSLEYIQDYLNIYGLKVWQEEVCRIINYNVEQERNEFLKKKVYDWQSVYQSTEAPIPSFPRPQTHDQGSFVNFTGRTARAGS
jgi:WASH complex subunit strumpellin